MSIQSKDTSMMKNELLVVGVGGLAKEVAQLAWQINQRIGQWSQISYVAESSTERDTELAYGGVRYCDDDLARITQETDVVIGVGSPLVRQRIAAKLALNPALRFPNLIHPQVEFDEKVIALGQGNLICKGVALTCDIVIGDFNLFNLNVTVGHDTRIGSYCVINPGSNISGNVTIGDTCLLGTGCQLLEQCAVVSNVVIGAGSLVRNNLAEAGTYVGVPARRLK